MKGEGMGRLTTERQPGFEMVLQWGERKMTIFKFYLPVYKNKCLVFITHMITDFLRLQSIQFETYLVLMFDTLSLLLGIITCHNHLLLFTEISVESHLLSSPTTYHSP